MCFYAKIIRFIRVNYSSVGHVLKFSFKGTPAQEERKIKNLIPTEAPF